MSGPEEEATPVPESPDPPPEQGEQPSSGRGGWLPRGALVALGLVVLLVVAFALLRPAVLDEDDRGGSGAPGDARQRHDEGDVVTTLADTGAVDGLRLSDDNSTSQTFTVTLPVDAGVEDAWVRLVGTTRSPSTSSVSLRVLADGQAVHVSRLPTGAHRLDVEADLPASAVADGSVRVQVRLTGTADQRRCTLTQDLGALVVLDPDGTRVEADVDGPLTTVRDVAATLGHEVTLVELSAGAEWVATAARLGVALTQAGHAVTFSTDADDAGPGTVLVGTPEEVGGATGGDPADGTVVVADAGGGPALAVTEPGGAAVGTLLTTAALATADGPTAEPVTLEPARVAADGAGGTVTLASLGADTGVQQLTDRHTWRVRYSLADLPGGEVPTRALLSWSLPPTSDDARWLVQVQLGDELVASDRLPGDATTARVSVPLPARLAAVRNQLVVTLVRDRDVGGCHVRQTTYDVQLLPGSVLELGGAGGSASSGGFVGVVDAFSAGVDVVLPDAAVADPAATLTALVPTLAELAPWQPTLRLVESDAPQGRPFLLVGEPPASATVQVDAGSGAVTAAGVETGPLADGVVVQRVEAQGVGGQGATGVVVTAVGSGEAVLPDLGREGAWVLPAGGGGVEVDTAGRVVSLPPVRAGGTG
ncbi:hypothetical protein [Nocardioides sp. GY 10127]|uniref:hypothetical protein n=1 Tax=Nocardioides sp. GY 10127 TaxID=2569762 RepID=UPI0010A7CF00|nr:hypothetical protein [Nocardioides sp. GY 10127]TIC80023.1 hypothetical protein E8D37_15435 [Nocardioides sp. GY 10127]